MNQLGNFPAQTIVGFEMAVRAVRVFVKLEIPDATLDRLER
jgi:hypothetical protein